MRYHYQKPPLAVSIYGKTYRCNHPVYDRCTLYEMEEKGLAVIQQRFDPRHKTTRWGELAPWLTDAIYTAPGFKAYFEARAAAPNGEGLYPTVTVRQAMWALRMKPLPKARWETVFDRRDI